jgi:hypothetical protein
MAFNGKENVFKKVFLNKFSKIKDDEITFEVLGDLNSQSL